MYTGFQRQVCAVALNEIVNAVAINVTEANHLYTDSTGNLRSVAINNRI